MLVERYYKRCTAVGTHLYIGYVNRDQDKSSWPAKRCRKSLKWVKLSNSGDTLKLLIPSYSRKVISTVTSQKMIENEMGYRGSKSDFLSVKEQRVDGS
ncbi:hypothetical protein HYFRA_00013618 [Hymenoscyphus fraxineus]|uniref:Uncharacterized protein n=1 Tax=Hymenoscyphus fraxineus TaxID=746836 RepID=A0A9N9Q0E1_9HELO|nr:hypothetical protein HYFRA_00013618 [Hymenoscyphus fraxineus]